MSSGAEPPRVALHPAAPLVIALLALALLAGGGAAWPESARAQLVRGTVLEQSGAAPVAGAVVSLVSLGGTAVRETLTDDRGRFTLAAPAGGRYALEVKRIGFKRATSEAFALAVGEARETRLTVVPVPISQPPVHVTERSRCTERPDGGDAMAAVWEDARAALTATRISGAEGRYRATVVRFTRELLATTRRVLSEQRQEYPNLAVNFFHSAPASDLSRNGYVVTDRSGAAYYRAPDAEVLLSESFATEHCFWVIEGTDGNAGRIGLAFQPVHTRTLPDIEGVLWLDAKTRELRTLEFRYNTIPTSARGLRLGGEIDFARLPTGAWIVQRWVLRMPALQVIEQRETGEHGVVRVSRREAVRLIREEGGEVVTSVAVGPQDANRAPGSVTGVVVDSTRARPLSGAIVAIPGTRHSARSAEDGSFRLDSLPAGLYELTVAHPRVDSLGIANPTTEVDIRSGAVTRSDVGIPAVMTIASVLCPATHRVPDTGVLRGVVRDSTGAPAPRARVELVWTDNAAAAATGSSPSAGRVGLAVAADSAGRYLFCAVRAEQVLQVHASALGSVARELVRVPAGEIAVRDVQLRAERREERREKRP